jgi:hypothetical protein
MQSERRRLHACTAHVHCARAHCARACVSCARARDVLLLMMSDPPGPAAVDDVERSVVLCITLVPWMPLQVATQSGNSSGKATAGAARTQVSTAGFTCQDGAARTQEISEPSSRRWAPR